MTESCYCLLLILSMFLQCGGCAMDLGDLLTPMFFNDQTQRVNCRNCFVKAIQ